jgi:osmotically inducible lipoprotein OsmB
MTSSKVVKFVLIGCLAFSVASCGRTPGSRAVTGGLIGAGGGAVLGGVTGVGAGTGALIGGGAGAAGGALTAPRR